MAAASCWSTGRLASSVPAIAQGQVDGFADALPSAVEAGVDMVHDYRFESYNLKVLGVERFIQEARVYLRRARSSDSESFLVYLASP